MPLIVLVAVSEPIQADFTLTPGAKRSAHGPQLEKLALLSLISEAATVIAVVTRAGE